MIERISEMIDKIMYEEKLFQEINKNEVLKSVLEMLTDPSIELNEISDEELYERLKRILAIEALSEILKGLSPEQIKLFDETVKNY